MDCKGCGACCLGQNISVSPAVGDRVAQDFVDTNGCLKQIEGRCVFFDPLTRLCEYYPNRPRVCVRFPAGSARCWYIRLWAEVALNWFGLEPGQMPSEERIHAPFEPKMNEEDMTIISIPGMAGDAVKSAVARYNEAVILAHCY